VAAGAAPPPPHRRFSSPGKVFCHYPANGRGTGQGIAARGVFALRIAIQLNRNRKSRPGLTGRRACRVHAESRACPAGKEERVRGRARSRGGGPAGCTRGRGLARRGKEERVRGRARSRGGGPAGCTRSRGRARRGGRKSEFGDAPGRGAAGLPGARGVEGLPGGGRKSEFGDAPVRRAAGPPGARGVEGLPGGGRKSEFGDAPGRGAAGGRGYYGGRGARRKRATIAPLSTVSSRAAESSPADIELRPVIPTKLVRVVPYMGG